MDNREGIVSKASGFIGPKRTRDSYKRHTVAVPNPSGPEAHENPFLIPDQLKGCQPEYAVHIKYTQILISDLHVVADSAAGSPPGTVSSWGISLHYTQLPHQFPFWFATSRQRRRFWQRLHAKSLYL